MAGPPPPPQAFVVGSEWPLSHAEQYAELAFQRLAYEGGFPACKWTERHGGTTMRGFQCAVGHENGEGEYDDWCPFVFKISTSSKSGNTTTSAVNLKHDHPACSTNSREFKKYREDARVVVQDVEAELERLAEERFLEVRRADAFRECTSGVEMSAVVALPRQQEIIIWDLAVALGRKKAEAFEVRMDKSEALARDYPARGALRGHAPFYLANDLPQVPLISVSDPSSASTGTRAVSVLAHPVKATSSKVKNKNKKRPPEVKVAIRPKNETIAARSSTLAPASSSLSGLKRSKLVPPASKKRKVKSSSIEGSEHSTEELLVLRFVDSHPYASSTTHGPPSAPKLPQPPLSSDSTISCEFVPTGAADLAISDAEPGPSKLKSPSPKLEEGVALRDLELKPALQPSPGQLAQKGLFPPAFPDLSASQSVSRSSSASKPVFRLGSSSLDAPLGADTTATSPSFAVPAMPALVPLLNYLKHLAKAYAPPFEAQFQALGPVLARQGIANVDALLWTANDDLEAFMADVAPPDGSLKAVLRQFRQALQKRLAEARGKGEM
ncbi:hypothetical protein JCM6882_005147 [Rhodosporidiobolus microsporus]